MLKLHTQQFRAPDFLNLSGDYGLCFHPHLYGSDFVKTLRLIEIMMGGGACWAFFLRGLLCQYVIFLRIPYFTCYKGTSFFNSPKALCIHKRNVFLRGHGPAPAECRGSLMVLVTWSCRPPCYWFGALLICWISKRFPSIFIYISLYYLIQLF